MRQRPQFPGMASGGRPAGLPASLRGVVDLGALAAKPQPASAAAGGGAGSGPGSGAATASAFVYDTSDATFDQDVIERSMTVPVVLDFSAAWSDQSQQLSPVLERVAAEYAGRFVLARLDVDANPQLAQEFGVQSIPVVLAVVGGRLVPLFQGALPEAQIRQYVDELLKLAAENGVTGTATGEPAESLSAVPEPPMDPAMEAAYTALEADDLDGAARAFRNVLASNPGDQEAKLALAQVELMINTRGADAEQVRAAAEANPDDPDAQIAAAELDLALGHVEPAIDRLVQFVARSAGAERDRARLKLLSFFELLGPDDPRTDTGRKALMRVLF